jgi:hypothetical protein
MSTVTKNKTIAVARHYVYAAVAAVLTLYLSGNENPKDLALAALAAVAGPLLGYLDPKNVNYGINSTK